MGGRVLRRPIWGYSVCLRPIKGTPGLNELTCYLCFFIQFPKHIFTSHLLAFGEHYFRIGYCRIDEVMNNEIGHLLLWSVITSRDDDKKNILTAQTCLKRPKKGRELSEMMIQCKESLLEGPDDK